MSAQRCRSFHRQNHCFHVLRPPIQAPITIHIWHFSHGPPQIRSAAISPAVCFAAASKCLSLCTKRPVRIHNPISVIIVETSIRIGHIGCPGLKAVGKPSLQSPPRPARDCRHPEQTVPPSMACSGRNPRTRQNHRHHHPSNSWIIRTAIFGIGTVFGDSVAFLGGTCRGRTRHYRPRSPAPHRSSPLRAQAGDCCPPNHRRPHRNSNRLGLPHCSNGPEKHCRLLGYNHCLLKSNPQANLRLEHREYKPHSHLRLRRSPQSAAVNRHTDFGSCPTARCWFIFG